MDDYPAGHLAIPELQMLDPSQGNKRWADEQGQIWQPFAMSGWTRGLLEGVVGLETDWGGLTYIPCAGLPPVRLSRFPFRGGHWDVGIHS